VQIQHRAKPANRLLVLLACVAALLAGIAIDRIALAQQTGGGITRTILLRADDPAAPATYEAVMGIAEIAPGASAGRHKHYGIEIGYVLSGSVLVEHDGRPAATLKAGDTFRNDAVHDARNPGNTPAKLLAIYLVEKGKPLAEAVPR